MSLSYRFSLSIVSHGQASLIRLLLADLALLPLQDFEVLVTINVPEDESAFYGHPFPLRIIRNVIPKGFGGNHNTAFAESSGEFFVVVNPDIRIYSFDLKELISPFTNQKVAAVAPMVISGEGRVEDSARRFPTFFRFIRRVLFRQRELDYEFDDYPLVVDWVAGMFVVFRSDIYRKINGFDDRRFFMYLEDADICHRLHENGWQVVVNPRVEVTHMAQRASQRNLKHMRWHAVSALRYLTRL